MTQPPNPEDPQQPGQPGQPDQPGQPGQPGQPPYPPHQGGHQSGAQGGPAGHDPHGQWGQPQVEPAHTPSSASGFFQALFDFSFKSFITVKFASFIYAVALFLIGVGALVGLIAAFVTMSQEPLAGVFMLLLVLIAAPFYLLLVRLTLELYVATIRTAQNTATTAQELENLRWDLSQRR